MFGIFWSFKCAKPIDKTINFKINNHFQPLKALNGSTLPPITRKGQGTRMFVEENDSEMDLWIFVSKLARNSNPKPRILVMTITVIKKGCKTTTFRPCPHSPYCIRREFFCDGRVNCAWPDAEAGGTDEVQCNAEGTVKE